MRVSVLMSVVVTCHLASVAGANAAIRDFARSRHIHPGAADFSGRSARAFESLSLTEYGGGIGVFVSQNGVFSDPAPWSNIVGSTVGEATYLGFVQASNGDVTYQYSVPITNPIPLTRLQYGYDFVPRVVEASDGFFHLQFDLIQYFNYVVGSLQEVEVILDGQWTLGFVGTGGVTLTEIPLSSPLPFEVGDNFTYYPETNTTRFYASRVVTQPSSGGGMAYRVDLIGAAVPSGGVLGLVGFGGLVVVGRRRRAKIDVCPVR